MTEQPRDEVNRYARLGPLARALVDDHDAIALAELLVKADDDLERARRELADHAAAESADAAAGSYANGSEHAIAHPQPWLHIEFTSPDPTTANTSALNLRDHLQAEFPGVSMRISSNAVEAGTPPICELPHMSVAEEDECERGRHGAEPRPHHWLLQGARDLSIPVPRFTYRPVTPEMERAATERARQAAADSERTAAWFAATGGAIGAPAVEAEQPARTTVINPAADEPEHTCKPGASMYFCPTSGATESDCHGGFGQCCDRPDLHRPGPAATEATSTRKEPAHPHPCTATIEGRATPGGRQVQCTREARHPENHVGPKQGANGRVLWTDWNEGATPHKGQP